MYKTLAAFIAAILNIGFSVTFAQEFSFNPPANLSTQSTTSTMLPPREPTLSPEDFANSSTKAYQDQQAKVSELAAKQVQEAQTTKPNQASSVSKPMPAARPSLPVIPEQLSTEPKQKPINEVNHPGTLASPAPAATPAQSPIVQPYTGFQNPPSTHNDYNNGSTPRNNQNTGGWGSSIKY